VASTTSLKLLFIPEFVLGDVANKSRGERKIVEAMAPVAPKNFLRFIFIFIHDYD
jgi:hypothetical protein